MIAARPLSNQLIVLACALAAIVLGMALPARALGAFPGVNGAVFYSSSVPGDPNTDILYIPMGPRGDSQPEISVLGGRALTSSPASDDSPAVSPDGTRITFISTRLGNPDVFVMDSDGSDQTPVGPAPSNERDPSFSADGTRILFASDRDGDFDIYSMGVDGSSVVQLTDDPATDTTPAASPDGSRIAFTSTRSGTQGIYVMAAAGGPATALRDTAEQERSPDWAPDSSRVAFEQVGQLCGGGPPPVSAAKLVNADGSGFASLAVPGADDCNFDSNEPVFSPDGQLIAFSGDQNRLIEPSTHALGDFRFDLADIVPGSGPNFSITQSGMDDEKPSWQPLPDQLCRSRQLNAVGGSGQDSLEGWDQLNDTIAGGVGNDRINGVAGNDRLCGGSQNDVVLGSTGKDQLLGGPGKDRLVGGPGRDVCIGGGGKDVLKGCEVEKQ